MKHLIIKCKSPWFRSVLAIALVTVAAFFLSNALGRQTQSAPASPDAPSDAAAALTFSAPIELTGHPTIPCVLCFYQQDGEPEIKVDLWGNIYITGIQGVPGGVDLWKSINKGTNFVYMGQPDGLQDHCSNMTPEQCAALGGGDDQIDVSTGGYLYVSSLWAGSVTMSTSYDGGTGGVLPGQAWQVHPSAAAPGVPDDRQWVAAYGPQILYMTYASASLINPPGVIGLFVVKSTDAGKTFSAPTEITGITALNSVDVEGNLVVDPYNGNLYTAYVPNPGSNIINLARSTDGGSTWSISTAYTGPAGTDNRGVFPILAVDRGGNLHLAFTNSTATTHANCHVFLTSTANPGAATPTWTTAVRVDSGAASNSAVMPWIVAGSPGIVDVTWLGSTAASPNTANSDWFVFFSQVTSALSGPVFNQIQVTPNRVHNHSICFDGGGCAGDGSPHTEPGNRDLLEYYTMTLDPEGNANIAYSDSVTNCNQSGAPFCLSNAWFTKQTAGPSAYTPPAPPALVTFASNLSVPASSGFAEPNSWADTHNCIYGGSIDGANSRTYRSQNAGLTFSAMNLPLSPSSVGSGGDMDIVTVPKADGSRFDQIYAADLDNGDFKVVIWKSTDGGSTYFAPGASGSAGVITNVSSDRMWLWGDRGVPTANDQTVYLMDHEFASEDIRFEALVNDGTWSPFASGITEPELILPPNSTFPNTNPGHVFVGRGGPNAHMVYGVFGAGTLTTDTAAPPFGKMPNLWEAVGAPPAAGTPPAAPGPFTNYPVFKGLIDSPSTAIPGTATYGSHIGLLFPWAAADSAGNIYAVWATNSSRTNTVKTGTSTPSNTFDVWFAASHDGGVNFYGPRKVSSGVGTSIFPGIAAGDNGRVVISWYQTGAVGDPLVASGGTINGGPTTVPAGSTWNVMFAQSLNANSREPVFTAVTASDHPIHTGPICVNGLLCLLGGDRSLLDFFQTSIGPDGLANIFSADNGTTTLHVNYMRQNGGPLSVTNPSSVTCLPPLPPPTDVVSHKIHGASFVGDIHLLPPNPGIEMRRNTGTDVSGPNAGRDHELIITFPVAVNISSVTVTTNNPGDMPAPSGNVVAGNGTAVITVDLHNIQNPRRVTVGLNSTGFGPRNVLVGVLLGDRNSNALVNSTDTSIVQSQSGQVLSSSNFPSDVNVNGLINSTDTSIVQSKSGTGLP